MRAALTSCRQLVYITYLHNRPPTSPLFRRAALPVSGPQAEYPGQGSLLQQPPGNRGHFIITLSSYGKGDGENYFRVHLSVKYNWGQLVACKHNDNYVTGDRSCGAGAGLRGPGPRGPGDARQGGGGAGDCHHPAHPGLGA